MMWFVKGVHWILILVCSLAFSANVYSAQPALQFSDLISGPDVGLGDGLGSGVIVTVWGQQLGSSQGSSKIEFCDSAGVCREGHVYYWKNADGLAPSGPANLYASHRMQEIAFSIPDSASGAGLIKVTTAEGVSTLPFTVRTGSIYHVKSGGSDSGDGSWAKPWLTVEKAVSSITTEGPTVYVQDVTSGRFDPTGRQFGVYYNSPKAPSSLTAQAAYTSYPGTRAIAAGTRGVSPRNAEAFVLSKYEVYASNHTGESSTGQPESYVDSSTFGIKPSKNGRVVANKVTDLPGGCASSAGGAISGGGSDAYNAKIFGNEVYEYGCPGTSKLHHTTYMTIRSDNDLQIEGWEYGWNYLHDNHAKNGIHQYDQNANCGDVTTDILIHDNVVVNQGGAGISIGLSGCEANWPAKIYNNVLINVGLAAAWDGVDIRTSDGANLSGISVNQSGFLPTGPIEIYNNTIFNWNDDDLNPQYASCLRIVGGSESMAMSVTDNVCYTEKDKAFLYGFDDFSGITLGENVFYSSVSETKLSSDPELSLVGDQVKITETSPVIGKSAMGIRTDLYGNYRDSSHAIGAVEYTSAEVVPPPSPPMPPSALTVQIK